MPAARSRRRRPPRQLAPLARGRRSLLQELGFTDYRFSLEWSRIEPADGEFSNVALDHYARVCEGLREARASHRW